MDETGGHNSKVNKQVAEGQSIILFILHEVSKVINL